MFFSRSVVRGARRASNIVYSFENVHLCSEEKIAQIKSCVTNTVVTFGNPSTLRGIDPYLIRTICTTRMYQGKTIICARVDSDHCSQVPIQITVHTQINGLKCKNSGI